MKICWGEGVNQGMARGQIVCFIKDRYEVQRRKISAVNEEVKRVYSAIRTVEEELRVIISHMDARSGDGFAIMQAQITLLNDEEFQTSVESMIRKDKVCAEYCVQRVIKGYIKTFSTLNDALVRERILDLQDIGKRLISALIGEREQKIKQESDYILFAEDLTPSEIMQLDKAKLRGIVLQHGSQNSHTSIIARSFNIPMVIKCSFNFVDIAAENSDASYCILDATSEEVYINPDFETARVLDEKIKDYHDSLQLMQQYLDLEDVTLDGKKVSVMVNAGSLGDIERAMEVNASGIGLLRSEFIYMDGKEYPNKDKQFAIYKKALEIAGGKPVVVRTLDIGGEKDIDYVDFPKEPNPALGERGIRFGFKNKKYLYDQLFAIYRASVYGDIRIMFPMIISIEEIQQIKKAIANVKSALYKEGFSYGNVKLGLMIETPASVVISDLLAKEVDFFSIGTNDLTQYTLAADRQNPAMDKYFKKLDVSVERQIQTVIDNGHAAGIKVGICGEIAAHQEAVKKLITMGIDELSVPAGKVLLTRKKVRETNWRK